jgi:membrane protein
MSPFTHIRAFIKDIIDEWGSHMPHRQAAALAYYGMFSFAPMLFIALTVAGLFLNELAMVEEIFDRMNGLLGPETTEFIYDMVVGASERTSSGSLITSLISLGALLYAATGLFAQLKYSLNVIWDVPPSAQAGIMNYILTRLLAFALVLGIGLMLILATAVSIFSSILTGLFNFDFELPFASSLSFVAIVAFSFAVLYKILPDTKISYRDVWLGALVTAALFGVGRWGLGFYLTNSSISSAFQAAGALAIVLIAIYYCAQLFLFGAIFTKVYARRYGSRKDEIDNDGDHSDSVDVERAKN